MNEDDTFRALRRAPLATVYNEIWAPGWVRDKRSVEDIIKKHNWTPEEYYNARLELLRSEENVREYGD